MKTFLHKETKSQIDFYIGIERIGSVIFHQICRQCLSIWSDMKLSFIPFIAHFREARTSANITWVFVLFFSLNFIMAHAQPVVVNTIPEEIESFNFAGNSINYFALPLTSDSIYVGKVFTVTANTITVATNPTPWTTGTLATAPAPYFVKFLSGSETGRVILVTANTSNSLTLDTTDNSSQTVSLTTPGFSVAVGDAFEVFPGDTLASLFGNNTSQYPLVFQGAASIFTADSVSIYSTASAAFKSFFFNTTAGYWEASGSTANCNNTILYPYIGIAVTRRINETAISLALSGRVAEVPIITKTIGSGGTIYNSTDYAVNMTLSQLKFGPNWVQSGSVSTADTVSIWNLSLSRFTTYYQYTDSTWRLSGDPNNIDRSSVVVPAGTNLNIIQISTVSGATSYLSSVMPYTLN